ncbi:sulfatase family protein [Pseudaestuariivita atlantica]|uniref:Sulfatase n=1 Tax=Pseudaestuariivita atlantica TaxID=1317121 RepID=A0A0L1JK21_9RHOB|nr:sulfatase-like hydrolase/transferase [Pseudaestuariivita atlantica]KNG92100.1 sulfatase [Pseudaestuariivita atlantica]
MTKRPNFLFIMTDQQRSDWLGCMGHPVVRTPHIDALAARGTLFRDFHAASPICMPNRASFMTGRMPSQHGLRYNGCTLPVTANTFVDVLAAAGYDTAAFGKSHLQPFTEDDPRHAPDAPDLPPRPVEEAWSTPPAPSAEAPANFPEGGYTPVKTPYFGFQRVEFAARHGAHVGGHYEQWFKATAPDWKALRDPANELPHDYTCPQAYRTPIPEELYPTTWIADRAIDYLQEPYRGAAPFFAYVSFPDPHHPFNPPGRYWDMYDPADFDLSLPFEAHRNPPPPMAWLDEQYRAGGGQFTPQTATRVGARQLQEAMALTAGMITMIDDQVGRLIAALKASGQYDNTVIVFNSDHGDYLGDFGMLLKGSLPFRSITQVPMIWSDPADRSARDFLDLASTIDLAPSILDRAGLTPFRGMQGRSFVPALSGGRHRDEVLIEFNDGPAKLGFASPARVRTLRDKRWRFTIYAGEDWGELYDLQADPDETHNLWDDPDHRAVRGDLSLRLAHLLTRQMDESPRSTRIA